ncbi:amino acid adenylation domain-containing protein [Myxococcus sp. AM009]|uniref:non-ribosomal peptide synthetase n=1 Tax=Myxococcus sp. AM009 TaxID=2745137 RepID=UPI001595F820|nr:non-ribosomal peptide synthetase [Myxococcus sp. AM009]NVI98247.1 amino acid adenylation domain-containing protein [Myxococcus sp. AM009]
MRHTLVELLQERALSEPRHEAFTFLGDAGAPAVRVDYSSMDVLARAIAAHLQADGRVGERALLLYAPGPEYVAAFFGCLYAGVVAVPVYPPDTARLERSLLRLRTVARDSRASVVLTTSFLQGLAGAMFELAPELGRLSWVATDGIALEEAGAWTPPGLSGDSVAFLQYTSGSTTDPKGVVLTHRNLMHNLSVIHERFQLSRSSRGVIWLPPYHDMGLIGGVLTPIFGGLPVDLMSPLSFLQEPLRWLKTLSERRGTCSGGPNFAYELCVRKISDEQKAGLDLSSWELAFCGAEPIRPDTLEAFSKAFEPCGFRREAFYPCYGLAEGTLIVTGVSKGRVARVEHFQRGALEAHRAVAASSPREAARDTVRHVSCGTVVPDEQVLIVDPESRTELPPGHIGEIWVRGPSVAQGYWLRPEETARTFQARLAGGAGEPWLRTGDLGFLHDGELFVSGRRKDLLVIQGRNYYPQDLELTVERSHPALRPGCAAVFSVSVGASEEVVVVQEVDRRYPGGDWPDVIAAIRRDISEQHALRVHAVVLIKSSSLPKTSSGKVQRGATREAYLEGQLDTVSADTAQEPVGEFSLSRASLLERPEAERLPALVAYLASAAARAGSLPRAILTGEARLPALGLDSLALVELKHRIEQDLEVALELRLLLEGPTLGALAVHLLEAAGRDARPVSAPTPGTGERLPVPPGQRALWFLHQLAPDSPGYTIARAICLQGALDVEALRRAFQSLVARHPALRATFPMVGEEPVQQVHAHVPASFQVVDASGDDEAALRRRLLREAYRPFDLGRGPLLRTHLFSRAAHAHVLLLSVHHIIVDFWSLAVLVDELRRLYEAGGDGVVLPPVGQPADAIRWQAEYMAGPSHEEDWGYWRQRLAGPLPRLELPAPALSSSGAAPSEPYHRFMLGGALRQRVAAFSRKRGLTPYVTLLAGFHALLHRLTGQDDIVVGSPVATRNWKGASRLVGYYVNTLPLRVALSGEPSFSLLVDRVGEAVRGALKHQGFPFPLMVERLQPERLGDRTPIFQSLFVYQRAPLSEQPELAGFAVGDGSARLRLGEASMSLLPLPPGAAQFELTLAVAPVGEGLACTLEYDTARFDAGTAERLGAQYERLLSAALDAEDTPVSRLPLLPEAQREQLLRHWNATTRPYPEDACLHHLVAAQAARTPEGIALVCGAERLTYARLMARVRTLAARLRRHGVGPEVRVGVFSLRTADLVVGLLAVLEAGGAYVPLDPNYPRQRLDFIVRDAEMPVLLTQRALASRLSPHGARLLFLEEPDTQEGSLPTPAPVQPEQLAYVLYTSGSTGQPKGVAISHRSAATFVQWAGETFSTEELTGVLAATSICFDLSVFELFVPLSHGGRVILADTALHLLELPAASEVTLINTVPSAITELLNASGIPSSVRTINLAGEPLTSDLVARLYAETPAARVMNLYGPSETTTYSTYTPLPAQAVEPVSIGRPVANTQVYVLDRHLAPVPVGVRGELFIGGAGVARGYLGRPRMTAERFLPDPFRETPGARMYRTGDIVRYRAEGSLEFLGRADHQVKVRGFRIEFEEIETALRNHPAVREAVVVARGTGAERQLVAYVVLAAHGESLVPELREHLRGRLPDYMVPGVFVVMEVLPLTPNGKVDRAALPEPRASSLAPGQDYLAPRDELEARIAAIWEGLLRRERVGVHDSFFDLGGNSLLATRLATRLAAALQVQAGVRTVFEHRTVAAQAAHFTQATKTHQAHSPIVAQPRVPYRGR